MVVNSSSRPTSGDRPGSADRCTPAAHARPTRQPANPPTRQPANPQRGHGPLDLVWVGQDGDQKASRLEAQQRPGGEVGLAHVHRPDDVDLVAGHGCTGPPARTAATTSATPWVEAVAKVSSSSSASWV